MLDKTTFEKVLGELDYFSKSYNSIPLRAVFDSAGINKELPYDELMKILDAFVEKHLNFLSAELLQQITLTVIL